MSRGTVVDITAMTRVEAVRNLPATCAFVGAAVVSLFLFICEGEAEGTERSRRVLFLHSYNYTLPVTAVIAEGARDRLVKANKSIEVDAVYLDAARYVEPEQEAAMARFLRDRYAQTPPDVVMPIGPDALAFTIKHRQEFAANVPVVFVGISRASYESSKAPPGITGHIIDLDLNFDRTLALAATLQPKARRLYVVAGSALVDTRWQAIARRIIGGWDRQFETTYLFNLSYDELTRQVSQIPAGAIVLYLNVLRDSAGKTFIPGELAAELSKLSKAPMYSPYFHPLKSTVGGFYERPETMGTTGADIVLEVLAGKDPASIPPRASPELGYSVNYKTMERYGLTIRNLPAGTFIVDRPASLWELYRWYVIGAVSLIALQTLLIAGLIVQRRRRQAAEANIRAKESALRVSYNQVRKLNTQLINAQEDERARIARDLHDDVGQRLASLSIGLSTLGRRTAVSDQSTRTELASLQKSAVELSKDLRDLSHELHPGILQHVDLPDALRARFEDIGATSGISLEVDADSSWSAVSEEISLCLYRVAQESLRNAVKHSNASTVHISLGSENGRVVMSIADDGKGFEASDANGFSGIGLLSMHERVRMLNGSLTVRSSKGNGTIATVKIPVGGSP